MYRKAFSDCLFEAENKLLNAIIRALRIAGFRVDAKVHDGCHVRKVAGMETIPDDVIATVVRHVKETTGFDIGLKVKTFEVPTIVPKPYFVKMALPPLLGKRKRSTIVIFLQEYVVNELGWTDGWMDR